MYMIRLNAGYTPSGTPKRIFVLMAADGTLETTFDEGWDDILAVPEQYRELARRARMFQTTNAEYKEMVRIGKL